MEGKSITNRILMGVFGGTNVKGMEDLGNLPINFQGNLVSATTNKELSDLLSQAKSSKHLVVINYGATWYGEKWNLGCVHVLMSVMHVGRCYQHFVMQANENPKTLFIYADIYKCEQETHDVCYTPTFRVYTDGYKVDEFYGA